jgi:hypothetical protein
MLSRYAVVGGKELRRYIHVINIYIIFYCDIKQQVSLNRMESYALTESNLKFNPARGEWEFQ